MGISRRIGTFLWLGCAAGLCTTASLAQSEGTCETLKVASSDFWFPYVISRNQKQQIGTAFYALELALKDHPVKIEYDYTDIWTRAVANVKSGKLDMMIALRHTPDRDNDLIFTAPWAEDVFGILTKKDRTFAYSGKASLEGKTGLRMRGANFPAELSYDLENQKLIQVPDIKSMVTVLDRDRVDYAPVSTLSFSYILAKFSAMPSAYTILENSRSPSQIYMAISKNSPCQSILPYLNAKLIEHRDDIAAYTETLFKNQGIEAIERD